MKKIFLFMLLLYFLYIATGCSSQSDAVYEKTIYNDKNIVITNTYDCYGHLISKSEVHLDTGITIAYLYSWDEGFSVNLCSNIEIVTIDKEGNIIGSTE